MTDERQPVTAWDEYRNDVLDHMVHEKDCDWPTIGECACDAGEMLTALLRSRREASPAASGDAPDVPPQPIDADMLAEALKATLKVYDADIGWRRGSGYDHGDPPTVEQIARGMAARLPL